MTELGKGYISVAQVSHLLGPKEWPVHRVRRWLVREGAVVRKGRYLYTTRAKLRAVFPEVYEELFMGGF